MASLRLLLFLLFGFYVQSTLAEKLTVFTDNKTDFKYLLANDKKIALSITTNLLALDIDANFTIDFKYVSTKRSLILMNDTVNVCAINKIKTKERLNNFIFSKPVNIFLTQRLYQHSNFEALNSDSNDNSPVVLSEIFRQQPKAKMIISSQISYGDVLDKQLADIPAVNKMVRHSAEQDEGTLKMFAKGRAQFAILYPHQVFETRHEFDARSYEISSIDPYVLGRLMCTNNKTTRKFVEVVNKRLSKKNTVEQLKQIHLNFINPNDSDILIGYFDKVFKIVD